MNDDGLGLVICAGVTIPIDKIEIRHGQVEITASRKGPVDANEGSPVTIFGADGQGFCQGAWISWGATRAEDTLQVTLRLSPDVIY